MPGNFLLNSGLCIEKLTGALEDVFFLHKGFTFSFGRYLGKGHLTLTKSGINLMLSFSLCKSLSIPVSPLSLRHNPSGVPVKTLGCLLDLLSLAGPEFKFFSFQPHRTAKGLLSFLPTTFYLTSQCFILH